MNDIRIVNEPKNLKYQFGCSTEENRYWMDIQHCQQQDEKVYTIYISYDDGRLHDESSAYLFVESKFNRSFSDGNSWFEKQRINRWKQKISPR